MCYVNRKAHGEWKMIAKTKVRICGRQFAENGKYIIAIAPNWKNVWHVRIVNEKLKGWSLEMGRISVDIPDELEKKLRFKTIERFGGKKGDLSRAVQEALETWINKKQ